MATGVALFKIAFPESLCVSRAHGYDVYLERNQYHYLPMRRLIFSKLDQVHFVSSHGRNYSSIKFGDFKSFSVSYLGVEPKYLLNAISGRSGKLHLVSCSSVIPVKRIHLIVASLSRIDKIQIQWTHIGGGKMLAEIKELAKELLDVKPNIAFQFLGHLSNQDVLSFYSNNQVDLFINSSESEGLPVSIMEAFAFSVPVIAPDVGGIREIVQNGLNGIIIGTEGDVEQIAEAITWFSSQDLKSRRIMSGKARLTWEQKFNAEVNYTDFVKQLVHV
jgi:glycosyltransferase involved in cell wall biosynthesis